jgi:hypothetical protein
VPLNPRRIFVGRLLGPLVRPICTNEKSFSQNTPTGNNLLVADQRDFPRECGRFKSCLREVYLQRIADLFFR